MHKDFEDSFVRFTRAQSVQTRNTLLAAPWSAELQAQFEAMAAESVAEQQRIEGADTMPFEKYRQAYQSPERLGI